MANRQFKSPTHMEFRAVIIFFSSLSFLFSYDDDSLLKEENPINDGTKKKKLRNFCKKSLKCWIKECKTHSFQTK